MNFPDFKITPKKQKKEKFFLDGWSHVSNVMPYFKLNICAA